MTLDHIQAVPENNNVPFDDLPLGAVFQNIGPKIKLTTYSCIPFDEFDDWLAGKGGLTWTKVRDGYAGPVVDLGNEARLQQIQNRYSEIHEAAGTSFKDMDVDHLVEQSRKQLARLTSPKIKKEEEPLNLLATPLQMSWRDVPVGGIILTRMPNNIIRVYQNDGSGYGVLLSSDFKTWDRKPLGPPQAVETHGARDFADDDQVYLVYRPSAS